MNRIPSTDQACDKVSIQVLIMKHKSFQGSGESANCIYLMTTLILANSLFFTVLPQLPYLYCSSKDVTRRAGVCRRDFFRME